MMTNLYGSRWAWRFLAALVAAVSCVTATAPAVAQPPNQQLFMDVPEAGLSDAQTRRLGIYRDDPTAAEVTIIRIDVDRLQQAGRLDIPLMHGDRLRLHGMQVQRRSPTNFDIIGDTADDASDFTLVVDGNDVVGTIRKGEQLYSVRPLGDGTQALIRRDPNAFPPDHPPEFEEEMEKRMQEKAPLLEQLDKMDRSGLEDSGSTTDVLVAWTQGAANQAGNINALIQLAITETNQSYANSRINPRLRLVHSYRTNYTESGNMRRDRDRFRITNDGFMDEVHGLRNRHRADLAILVTARGGYCGIAADILASPETGFAVVGQDCATGYYSFGHEIGHLQGARHDPEADSSTDPFSYGHGFCYKTGNWRTVMSYNNGCRNRLQYWSNPSVRRGTVAMGTSATNNNARVLNNTAAYIANFRVAAATPCRSGFMPAGSRLCISTNANSARSYANAMVFCRDRRSRVASYGDLRYLYVRTGIDAAFNPNGRWIGNFVDDDRALCGNRAITRDNDPDIGNFEGTCNRFDTRSFWCAYDR